MKGDHDLERWLLGKTNSERAAQIRERTRQTEAIRNVYDDYFAVLRSLERGEGLQLPSRESAPSQTASQPAQSASAEELRWLSDDFFASWPEPARKGWFEGWRARMRLPSALTQTVLASALVLGFVGVWLQDAAREPSGGSVASAPDGARLVARGRGRDAELELELFCGKPAAPVNGGRCELSQDLTFAVRATKSSDARVLTVFGIGADGDVKYYAPTPADGSGVPVVGAHWQALDFSVRLDVNHGAGPLKVFALLAPRAAQVREIEAWSVALSEHDLERTEIWLTRLEEIDSALVADLCPQTDACDAVQTELSLYSLENHDEWHD